MHELIVAEKLAEWQRLKALVLDSVSSPITRRLYNLALDDFMRWFQQEARLGFTKATVNAWRMSLEARGLGSSSISVRLSAIRKLAAEAAANGLLPPEVVRPEFTFQALVSAANFKADRSSVNSTGQIVCYRQF